MDSGISRNIPAEVRRYLRQEVNYGCPLDSCGSPFLSYHHFNPPWHEENHHNPNGMIALCLHHHKAADNGAYTCDQLKKLKSNPHLSNDDILIGNIAWKRESILFDIGGNYYLGPSEIYLRKSEKLIWLEFDDHKHMMINFDVKDKEGNLIFSMRNNDWIVTTAIQDIESPPSMKMIKLNDTKKGVRLNIEFKSYSIEQFVKEYQKIINDDILLNSITGLLPQDLVLCKVRGLLRYPFHIHFKDGKTYMKNVKGPFKLNNYLDLAENATIGEIELMNNFFVGNGIIIS